MSTLLTNPPTIVQHATRSRATTRPALISRRAGFMLLLILAIVVFLIASSLPRIAQPQSYHHFADQRSFIGIPNFGDVASNLPFAVIGLCGLCFVLKAYLGSTPYFVHREEVWPYCLFFVGLLLTAFGSSWYHLAPDNHRLVWDRLPMTIAFMSLVAAVIVERIDPRLGLCLLPILLSIGIASVVQWNVSEARGHGDLRFYAALQAYSAGVLLLALVLPQRYTSDSDLWLVLGFYFLAKVLESFDHRIFIAVHLASGHTLKHLAAAASGFCVLRMIRRRQPLTNTFSSNLCSNGAQNA